MIGMFQDGFREQNIFIERSVEYQEFESVEKKVRYFFCSEYCSEGAEMLKGGVNFNWSMK